MRALATAIFLIVIAFSAPDLHADSDSDGDGQTDAQELAAGTDPNNEFSVAWKHLAAWRFSNSSLAGESGQQPLLSSNVVFVSGLDGGGVDLPGTNTLSFLKYRAHETNGLANLAPKRGAVWMYFKPHWFSVDDFFPEFAGVGPEHWATVLETANFRLRIDPQGTKLILNSDLPGGGTTNNIEVPLDIYRLDPVDDPRDPGEEAWYALFLSYSPEATRIVWADPWSSRYTKSGPGIAPASEPLEDQFLSIGAAADGSGALKASIDEVMTFNVEGQLSTNAWLHSVILTNHSTGIELAWTGATNTLAQVKRRLFGAVEWEFLGGAVGASFVDSTALPGVRYEYNVNTRFIRPDASVDTIGQTVAGVRLGTPIEDRGRLLLLADQTLTNELRDELASYITNLTGDGWQVIRADVPRHVDDYSTTNSYLTNYFNITNVILPIIRSNYTQFGTNLKQIVLFGHVTVPYSGTRADDGHSFGLAHEGAWAADVFYGDVDGVWTDTILKVNSFFEWNKNYPSDGKFDQDFIPTNALGSREVEIPVCRIDLANMPVFGVSEPELLRRYLRKNAAFRAGEAVYPLDVLQFDTPIGGNPSQAPAQLGSEFSSGLSPLKPPINSDPFALGAPRALGGVVSGPGGFDNINFNFPSEHTAANIAGGQTSTNIPFLFVRASYLPDWNTTNNFLRAILGATNGGLASAAFFVPDAWRFDSLAIGDGLGGDIRDVLRTWRYEHISVRHISILGDATLRHPIVPPPGPVTWSMTNNSVYLAWAHPAGLQPVYNVYRSTNGMSGPFDRINNLAVSATAFTDLSAPAGNLQFMVRALALAETGAGSYTNISQGSFSAGLLAPDPSNCCIADQIANEDTILGPLEFNIGDAASQGGFQLLLSSTNTTLVPPANLVVQGTGATRTITIVPATNQVGTTLITISVVTDQAVTHRTFAVTFNAVNDAPSFTPGVDQMVAQGSGAQSVPGWAAAISPGPDNESGQTVSFAVTCDKAHLFSVAPTISAAGDLSFTPSATGRGTATVTVRAVDNGGTANSGQNTSDPRTFTIAIGLNSDLNANGLPDDFEETFGLNELLGVQAESDTDGDGFSNEQELWAGTHPLDSTSLVEIGSTRVAGGGFRFSFSTVPGRVYEIQYNDSFPSGEWLPLFSNFPGLGATVELADLAGFGSRSNRIYRVRSSEGGANFVYSGFAGYWRFAMQGRSDTPLSMPFIRPPAARGVIEEASGDSVQMSGAPPWTTNRWAYSSGVQSNSYFLLVASGAMEGAYYTIVGNSSNQVFLDLDGGTLNGIAPGDRALIVPYWTMGTIFPAAAGVHQSPRASSRSTEILIPNRESSGINLPPLRTLYYLNTWRQSGSGLTNFNDDVVLPEMFLWVRHNITNWTEVAAHGIALPTKLRIPMRYRVGGEQDHYVAIPRPNAVALGGSGLADNGAFRSSVRAGNRIDELLTFDASIPVFNRPPIETYYLLQNQWRRSGSGATDMSGAPVFQPGSGAVLRLDPRDGSVVWINPPNY